LNQATFFPQTFPIIIDEVLSLKLVLWWAAGDEAARSFCPMTARASNFGIQASKPLQRIFQAYGD
jgi:hypothetical protein